MAGTRYDLPKVLRPGEQLPAASSLGRWLLSHTLYADSVGRVDDPNLAVQAIVIHSGLQDSLLLEAAASRLEMQAGELQMLGGLSAAQVLELVPGQPRGLRPERFFP